MPTINFMNGDYNISVAPEEFVFTKKDLIKFRTLKVEEIEFAINTNKNLLNEHYNHLYPIHWVLYNEDVSALKKVVDLMDAEGVPLAKVTRKDYHTTNQKFFANMTPLNLAMVLNDVDKFNCLLGAGQRDYNLEFPEPISFLDWDGRRKYYGGEWVVGATAVRLKDKSNIKMSLLSYLFYFDSDKIVKTLLDNAPQENLFVLLKEFAEDLYKFRLSGAVRSDKTKEGFWSCHVWQKVIKNGMSIIGNSWARKMGKWDGVNDDGGSLNVVAELLDGLLENNFFFDDPNPEVFLREMNEVASIFASNETIYKKIGDIYTSERMMEVVRLLRSCSATPAMSAMIDNAINDYLIIKENFSLNEGILKSHLVRKIKNKV